MTSSALPEKNTEIILNAMESLDSDVDLLCLPENSLYINLAKAPISKDNAFTSNSPEVRKLQQACVDHNLYLHLGGVPWLINNEVFNEAILINPKGQIEGTYEKIHLFDVELAPGIEVRESLSYKPGHRLTSFDIKGWKIATCICYDVRFPELFIHYVEKEKVDFFLVPSAFTVKTGKSHWKTLLQARAIETQCYLVAAAQVGWHCNEAGEKIRKSWGQSVAFGPWGESLGETQSFDDFLDSWTDVHVPITLIANKSAIEEARTAIPISEHRAFAMELKKND